MFIPKNFTCDTIWIVSLLFNCKALGCRTLSKLIHRNLVTMILPKQLRVLSIEINYKHIHVNTERTTCMLELLSRENMIFNMIFSNSSISQSLSALYICHWYFFTSNGVKQGGVIPPILFKLYLNEFIEL